MVFGVFIGYLSGYRLSAMSAARANSFIGSTAHEFAQVAYAGGKVIMFNTKNGPRTILDNHDGPVWRAPVSAAFSPLKPAAINTVGWMASSVNNHPITVAAFVVKSARIKTVEIGPPEDREKKTVHLDIPLIFTWNHLIGFDSMNPLALSQTGTPLYRYGYPLHGKKSHVAWYPDN